MTTAEDLLTKIKERFFKYAEGGRIDDSLVLCDTAAEEARRCWKETVKGRDPGDSALGLPTVQALGWLHFARHMALPFGRDANDLQASATFFVPVIIADPTQVPDRIAEFLSPPRAFAMIMDDNRLAGFLPNSYVQQAYPKAYAHAEYILDNR